MRHATRLGRLSGLAIGLGIGAVVAATPGVASADPPIDWLLSIDQLLGGLSVPAADPAQALDIQVSIFGLDLFPTAGNTATATSVAGLGDIAIAIGNGANATVSGASIFDFAFADGANSVASVENFFGPELGQPNIFDIAFVLGTGSTATISGEGENFVPEPSNFDVAGVFGDMLNASVTNASGLVDILTPFGTL